MKFSLCMRDAHYTMNPKVQRHISFHFCRTMQLRQAWTVLCRKKWYFNIVLSLFSFPLSPTQQNSIKNNISWIYYLKSVWTCCHFFFLWWPCLSDCIVNSRSKRNRRLAGYQPVFLFIIRSWKKAMMKGMR